MADQTAVVFLFTAVYGAAGRKHMGKKDITGKAYFKDAARFAELMNAVLYRGEKIIRPEKLVPMEREYPALSGDTDKSRDVFMKDTEYQILYGLELETESDYSMPERVMVYDACEYEQQIRKIAGTRKKTQTKDTYREKKSRLRAEDYLLPVITVVLYLGEDHWEGRRKLSDLFQVPDKIKKRLEGRIPEYDFRLIEADYVNAEDYETDLREFFRIMQCRKDKGKMNELCHSERFRNLDPETVRAIAIHIDRKGLMPKVEKEGVILCQAFDELMEDKRQEGIEQGIQQGMQEGIKEGERKCKISIIRRMLEAGMEGAQIRRITQCSEEEILLAEGR